MRTDAAGARPERKPLVSVVVPARNEAQSIRECLATIARQTYGHLEIIVVDGCSDDETPHLVSSAIQGDARIRLVSNPERVTPAALNRGLAEARGEFLIRIDAHAYPEPDYVERIVSHLLTGEYAGVGGRKVAVGGSSATSRVIAAALGSRFGVGGSEYHYASRATLTDHIPFGAYRTAFLREIGGWDGRALVNQDFELDYRIRLAGGSLLLDPRIRARWKSSLTLRTLAYQYRRYGKGKAIVARLHPRSLRMRHLVPLACLAWLVGSVVMALSLTNPLPLLGLAPYTGFLLASLSDPRLRRSSPYSWILAPAVLGVMHLSWAIGFVSELARNLLSLDQPRDPFRSRDLPQAVD
jgi:glycosyltransferase involved in cell wall biosynthesis